MTKASFGEERVQKRSAADFFHDNKAIAGFDNPMRVVFTSIRELVENGLDAAEKINNLPEIVVEIERLPKEQIAELLDVESIDASQRTDFIKLSVRDNGSGIPMSFVPQLFGRVLTGSNYGARQSRGRFGLGAKMVLLNAQATVDLPMIIKSKHVDEDFTSYHELLIDLARNEPIIVNKREIAQETTEAIQNSGTEVSVTFTGSWNLAGRYIREYFSNLAIITPYSTFKVKYPNIDTWTEFPRVVEEMPPFPSIAKIHPHGVDITQLKRELAINKTSNLVDFFTDHFQGVGKKKAKDFCEFVSIDPTKNPNKLTAKEIRRIVHDGFTVPDSDPKKRKVQKYFSFTKPSGESLSPLGVDRLIRGLEKELNPQFIRAAASDVSAYSGHPFVVETAIAYGGKRLSSDESSSRSGPIIYRFANRIPLLFGAGNDIITKCVLNEINWKHYKINIQKAPIAIVVSIVSSKIPFPETSKEYIADVEELKKEIVKVLQKLARSLRSHIGKAELERRRHQRQSRFEKAAPLIIENIAQILEGRSNIRLDSERERKKLTVALATAENRLIRRKKTPSTRISSIGEWLKPEIYSQLVVNSIQTILQLLWTPVPELMEITGLNRGEIIRIKRKTVLSSERIDNAPMMKDFKFFDRRIEIDFDKFREIPRIHKTLAKRWIVSSLDFFAASIKHLKSVEGLEEKLIFVEKQKSCKKLIDSREKDFFDIENLPWMSKSIKKGLKSVHIRTIFDYILSDPRKINQVPYLAIHLIDSVKDEIKKGIKKEYIKSDSVIGASTFEWMDSKITPRLRTRNITRIKEFLEMSSEKLSEIDELTRNLINQSQKLDNTDFKSILETYDITNIDTIASGKLKSTKIVNFLEFLLTPEKSLIEISDFTDNLIKSLREETYESILQNQEFTIQSVNEAYWLSDSLEKQFNDLNIFNVSDFVCTHTNKLLELSELDENTILIIKKTYGANIPFLNETEQSLVEKYKFFCLEDIWNNREILLKNIKTESKGFTDFINALDEPICYIPLKSLFYRKLHLIGVSTVYDFFSWVDQDIHSKSGLSFRQVEYIKSKLTISTLNELKRIKEINMTALANNLSTKLWKDYDFTNQSFQNFIYKIDDPKFIKESKISDKHIKDIFKVGNTPISFIQEIKPELIEKLRNSGIYTLIDLFSWDRENLTNLLGLSKIEMKSFTTSVKKFREGTSLSGLNVLEDREIKLLVSNGYTTFEDVYFRVKRESFDVKGIAWKKIERFFRILETPIAMLKTEDRNEGEVTGLEHSQIEILIDKNIDLIIKLLYFPIEDLMKILKVKKDDITKIKTNIMVKERGMPLADVIGLQKSKINALASFSIETVEDLFFTASEELFDDEEAVANVDWNEIKDIVSALELPITYVGDLIPEKYKLKLKNNKIDTIVRFLTTSEEELSKYLDTPTDNVDLFKKKINLNRFGDVTKSPLKTLDKISHQQFQILAEENIFSIFDFLKTPNEILTQILEIKSDEIDLIKSGITYETVKGGADLKVMSLVKMNILDKETSDNLKKVGIESLTDFYYKLTKEMIQESSDIDWSSIEKIRSVLSAPLISIPEFSNEEIKLLKKEKINTILDFLILKTEDISTNTELTEKRVSKIKNSIKVDKLINLFSQVPANILSLTDPQRKKIEQSDVINILELLNEDIIKNFKFNALDANNKIGTENWKIVNQFLNTPVDTVLKTHLDKDILKNLKSKKVRSIKDLLSLESERLTSLLSMNKEDTEKLLNKVDFNLLAKFYSLPIYLISDLEAEQVLSLCNEDIYTIGDFNFCDKSQLATITGFTTQKLSKIQSDMKVEELLAQSKEVDIDINLFSQSLDKKIIDSFISKEFNSIQRAILNYKSLVKSTADEFSKFIKQPISRLVKFPISDLNLLKKANVKNIAHWYLTSNDNLAKIIPYSVKDLQAMKTVSISVSNQEADSEIILLSSCIESGYIDFEEFESKYGLKSVTDLLIYDLDSLDNEKDKLIKSRITRLKNALNSSVSYIPNLPSKWVLPLALAGITSIFQLLETNYNEISDMVETNKKTFDGVKNSIELGSIIESMKKSKVNLSFIQALTPKQLELVQKLGVDDVVNFYFRLDPSRLSKPLMKSVENAKLVLQRSLATNSAVANDLPSKIKILAASGVVSLIDFFYWDRDELSQMLGIKRFELSKYRKLNIQKIRKKKTLGVPLTNMVKISEELAEKFKTMGIDCLEDLYFHLKRFNYIPEDEISNKTITSIIKDLERPVIKLADLPVPFKSKLESLGVTQTIDFLYYPEDVLRKVDGLTTKRIRYVRNHIRFRKEGDVLSGIEKYFKE